MEETVGVVAIYDDPSTKRAQDYLELYDSDEISSRWVRSIDSVFNGWL